MITPEEIIDLMSYSTKKYISSYDRLRILAYAQKQEKKDKLLELVLGEYDCLYISEMHDYIKKHGDEINKLREELKKCL